MLSLCCAGRVIIQIVSSQIMREGGTQKINNTFHKHHLPVYPAAWANDPDDIVRIWRTSRICRWAWQRANVWKRQRQVMMKLGLLFSVLSQLISHKSHDQECKSLCLCCLSVQRLSSPVTDLLPVNPAASRRVHYLSVSKLVCIYWG